MLLDTNVWSWTLLGNRRLTQAARDANDKARIRYLSPVSLYEVNQKIRLGKWPEMAPYAAQLLEFVDAQGLAFATPDAGIYAEAGNLDWSHRDPFDRLLAATALNYRIIPIISADAVFDGVVQRVW